MNFKKSMIRNMVTIAISAVATNVVAEEINLIGTNNNEISVDRSLLKVSGTATKSKKADNTYIVQLKGEPAIAHAQDIGELLPSNQLVGIAGNNYNASTPAMKAYAKKLEAAQNAVADSIGAVEILHSYKHTFNGFSTTLSDKQKSQLESHPDVVGVWQDELQKITTANTPEFLGLTGPDGQHTLGNKGEDIIIGIVDTGIAPDHPSFADDGSYSPAAGLGWTGSCDVNTDTEFTCNEKLIGARYFNSTFLTQYPLEPGEFESPRDADGHGSHTAGTSGGNEGVAATLSGVSAGTVSGIAPRARVAAYKACWNSDHDNSGCFYGDTMAAIDQAVVDGVDVINYSIGGSRTDLLTPPAQAKLRATQAGVFVAVSAGNSGPTAETVGTPAPWITSVAASTYDGTSTLVGKELNINSGPLSPGTMLAVPAGIAPAAEGLSGDLVAVAPLDACNVDPDDDSSPSSITNGAELVGKVALIARGACAFTQKFNNAQEAGAIGVIVYTYDGTSPFAMGGDAVSIPGSMVSYADGQSLLSSVGESTTNITFSDTNMAGEATEVGNVMANFSSRGPNTASYDIIKPDITAPGVKILAATTNTPMFGEHGNTFAYLQGTSMSSPHIAGMAALFKESNSSWSPAQIKSALMTTAYQGVTKEDGSTPADPFDFGAGHASPVDAMDPGLLYDANYMDYLGFLCGIGESDYVSGVDQDCDDLANNGFAIDPSQLNIPSIGIAELRAPETVSRTVTNATSEASVYTATIEAPAGVDVTLQTYDGSGTLVGDGTLPVEANGKASYALTFTKTDSAVFNEWAFGSITWTDDAGHSVRSPIAVKPLADIDIEVPEMVSGMMNRGRYTFFVPMLYSGATSLDYVNLAAPFGVAGSVAQDPEQSFEFLGAGTEYHGFLVPDGTKVLRFSLRDSMVTPEGSDLDMYVYRCIGYSCTQVGYSYNGGSNEDVIIADPEAANDGASGDFYIAMIHGYYTGGEESADYTLLGWIADESATTTRVYSSRRAINGRSNNVTVMDRSLSSTIYMGGVTFYNADGVAQGTTVLELGN